MKRAMRSSLTWIAKLGLTVAIIAAIAWKLDVKTIFGTFLFASPIAVGAGLLLALVQALLSAKRLALVVSIFGRVMPFSDALRVTLEGAFFSQTFVSFIGGDAQRIWRIRKCGFSSGDSISVVAFDRFIGILVNHLLVIVFLPYLLFAIPTNPIRIGLVVIAAGGLGIIAVALCVGLMRGRIESFLPDRIRSNRWVRLLSSIFTVARHLFMRDARLVASLGVSCLISLVNSLIFLFLLWGWNVPIASAFGSALLVTAVLEVAMLPISLAGWGVREGAIIFAFAGFGVSADIAFSSSVTFAFFGLVVGLLGGLLWLFDRRDIRSTAAELMDAGVGVQLQKQNSAPPLSL
jgi:glycosyltransferase 2 family protein